MKTIVKFIGNIFKGIWKAVSGLFKGIIQNTEGVVILVTSAIGFTAIISSLPFLIPVPMWIETSFVVPIISVLAVSLCLTVMRLRPEEAI